MDNYRTKYSKYKKKYYKLVKLMESFHKIEGGAYLDYRKPHRIHAILTMKEEGKDMILMFKKSDGKYYLPGGPIKESDGFNNDGTIKHNKDLYSIQRRFNEASGIQFPETREGNIIDYDKIKVYQGFISRIDSSNFIPTDQVDEIRYVNSKELNRFSKTIDDDTYNLLSRIFKKTIDFSYF